MHYTFCETNTSRVVSDRGRRTAVKVHTYQDVGAFWDEHDTTDFGGKTEVEFDVNIQSQRRYYSLDKHL